MKSLRAKWIVPVTRRPLEGGCVTIAGGRIVEVGPRPPAGAQVTDLGDVALLPGLVNAHTHLEFSDLVGPLGRPGMALPDWIRLVIAERRRGNRDAVAARSKGIAECHAAGVTTIGDVATVPPPEGARQDDSVLAFQESIGFSEQRIESALADLVQRFDSTAPRAGLSPHAPYTVHPRLLEAIVSLARARHAPVAMHLAESPEELQLLHDGTGPFRDLLEERSMWDARALPIGSRPMDYLRRLVAAPRALVIHGNYLATDEIEWAAQHRAVMSVVYCPRTHAYFAHSTYPLCELLAAGVRVTLGTDSRASNPDLSLLADLRFAAKAMPNVAPDAWLRMVTIDAAEALGLQQHVGALQPGMRADLIAVTCRKNPVEDVVFGDEPARVVALAAADTARAQQLGADEVGADAV